jgi:hypothetical protein
VNFYVIEVLGVPRVNDSLRLVQEMEMVELELIAHSFYFCFEDEMVSFIQLIKSVLVVLVTLLRNGEHDISKVFRFTWIHLDKDAHEMLISEHAVISTLLLGVDVETIPVNDVVFVSLAKKMQSVNLIFDDSFAAAGFKELIPSLINDHRLLIWSLKETMV